MWLLLALQYPFLWLRAPNGMTTVGGRTFVIADVYEAAFAASLFTLVTTGLLAIIRLAQSASFGSAQPD